MTSTRDALRAALEMPVVPPAYCEDLTLCLGLQSAGDEEVARAAARLAAAILAFLRERMPDVDRQPDLSRYLTDGTLERHLKG